MSTGELVAGVYVAAPYIMGLYVVLHVIFGI